MVAGDGNEYRLCGNFDVRKSGTVRSAFRKVRLPKWSAADLRSGRYPRSNPNRGNGQSGRGPGPSKYARRKYKVKAAFPELVYDLGP